MNGSHTRRVFLGTSSRFGIGLMLVHALPAWMFASASSAPRNRAYRERSFYTMGSVATVCAYGDSLAHIDEAVNKVIAEFARLDRLLSTYDPSSEISRINHASGRESVRVSPETWYLLERAAEFTRVTGDVFDVTTGPLMNLWGFRGQGIRQKPTDKQIGQALECIGIQRLTIDESENTVGLDRRGAGIDLGGIGVGYAVDRAVAILRSEGIEDAFINHSGDAFALGVPEGQDGWIVSIPDPDDHRITVKSYTVRDRAISTSGAYERYVTIDDVRYGHVMDVASGFPEVFDGSCTVVADTAMTADALSTAGFCREEIFKTANRGSRVSSIILARNGTRGWDVREHKGGAR